MLARKWLLILCNKLLAFASGFFVIYFVARGLGPSRYGILGFGMSFVGVFSAICDLGFDSAHIKRISEKKEIGSFIGAFFTVKAVLNFLFLCTILTAVFVVKRFRGGFESPAHEYVIYIMLISTILQVFLDCFTLTFDARLEVAKSQIIAFASLFIGSILSIIVALTLRSVIALAAVSIISNLAGLILAVSLFRGYNITFPKMEHIKKYFAFAFPLMISTIITTFYYYADRLFIQMFWSSEQVGYYYGAQKFPTFLLMISQTMIYLLFARMSNLHSGNDYTGLRNICRKSERYLSLIVTPLAIFLIAYAKPATEVLLGSSFAGSVSILQLLLIQALIYTINRPSAVVILGINKPKIQTIVTATLLPLTLILYIVLIPSKIFGIRMLGLGGVGAALALVIAAFLGLVITKIIVYKLISVLPYWRITLHIAVSISSCIVTLGIQKALNMDSLFYMPLLFTINLVLYIALLVIFKEIKKSDYQFVIEAINPGGMRNYIMTELKLKN